MAADAWKIYNQFRELMADGTIDLDNDTFKVALFLSTSNCADATLNNLADLTNQVANGNGYTTGGVVVTASWNRATATVTFDVSDPAWTASGGPITARYAVLYDDTPSSPADPLVAWCLLDNSPADVTVTDGNTLTLQINASNGVFTLSGG